MERLERERWIGWRWEGREGEVEGKVGRVEGRWGRVERGR